MKENKSKSKKVSKNKKIISKKPTKIIGKKNLKAMPVKPKEVIKKKEKKSRKKLIVLLLLLIGFVSIFSLSSFSSNFLAGNIASSSSLNSSTSVQSSEVKDSSVEARVNTIELVAVEVSKLPNKLEYYSTDNVSTSGGELRLSFSDYSVKYIPMNDKMIDYSRLDLSKVGNSKVMLNVEHNSIKKFVTYDVNVIPFVIKLESIRIDINNADLFVGQNLLLGYSFLPANSYIDQISWSSSNELIASVNSEGLVSAKNQGKVTITLTVNGTISNSTLVNVLPIPQVNAVPVPAPTPAPIPQTTDTTSPSITDSTITVSNLSNNSLTISWNLASDDITTAASLVYKIFQSNSSISNLTASNNLTPIQSSSNISTYNVTGLNQGTTYHFNVVVSDAAGNETIYNNVSATTTISYSTFAGYYLSADLSKPISTLSYPIPSGITQNDALTVLPTTIYEKDSNDLFNAVSVTWGLKQGVTFSNVSPDTNGVITTSIIGAATVGNTVTPQNIEGVLNVMASGAIPISNATQLSQIKPYSTKTTVTFGKGAYSKTETFLSTNSAMSKSYYLTNDIDLSTYNNGVWIPIGQSIQTASLFQGTLNGNNYRIYNFNNVANTRYAGLFGNVRGATISNLSLFGELNIDTNLQSQNIIDETGALISNNYGNDTTTSPFTTIDNVHTYVNISANNSSPIGGILGWNSNAGRIAISNSSNSGSIKQSESNTNNFSKIGGLVGTSQITTTRPTVNISRSFNAGTISTNALSAGGLIGYVNGSNFTIADSYNSGQIIATGQAGGIIGHNTNSEDTRIINRSYNIGKIFRQSGTSTDLGPIVGFSSSSINISNNYSLINSVDNQGTLSNGNGLSVTTYYTITQLKNQSNYNGYTFGSNNWVINENNTSAYLDNLPETISVSVSELEETNGASGQITNNIFNITLSNSEKYFESNILTSDVTANNLPDGLSYNVAYVDFNTITITISGTATTHTAASSINNLNFTISKNKINGANKDYQTRNIRVKFIDPAPAM